MTFALTPPESLNFSQTSSSAPMYQDDEVSHEEFQGDGQCIYSNQDGGFVSRIQSLNQQKLATLCTETTTDLWNVGTDQPFKNPEKQFKGAHKVTALGRFGDLLLTGTVNGLINAWDPNCAKNRKTITLGDQTEVTAITPCAVGTIAVGLKNNKIRLWDFTEQKEGPELREHSLQVTGVEKIETFRIASVSLDKNILVWDCKKGERIWGQYGVHESPILSLTRIEDTLFSGDERGSMIWTNISAPSRHCESYFQSSVNALDSINELLAVGLENGKVRIRDVRIASDGLNPLNHNGNPVKTVAFISPTMIATGSDCLRLWDLRYSGGSQDSLDSSQ